MQELPADHDSIYPTLKLSSKLALRQVPCIHWVAFIRRRSLVEEVIQGWLEEGNDIDAESIGSMDKITGYMTFCPRSCETALSWAVHNDNEIAVEALLRAGADPLKKSTSMAPSPRSLAVLSRSLPTLKIFHASIKNSLPSASVNALKLASVDGLFLGSIGARLATGRNFISKSLEMFRYLTDKELISRDQIYLVLSTQHVRSSLKYLPTLSSDDETSSLLLVSAISCPRTTARDIFTLLLGHLDSSYDLDVRFSVITAPGLPTPTSVDRTASGALTLLEQALIANKPDIALDLVDRKASTKVVTKANFFRQLLSTRTQCSHLALSRLLSSPFIALHPNFLVDQAILDPRHNYNILHFLSARSTPYNAESLKLLLAHFHATSPKVLQRLVSMHEVKDNSDGTQTRAFTPLHEAASQAFSAAMGHLLNFGTDPTS